MSTKFPLKLKNICVKAHEMHSAHSCSPEEQFVKVAPKIWHNLIGSLLLNVPSTLTLPTEINRFVCNDPTAFHPAPGKALRTVKLALCWSFHYTALGDAIRWLPLVLLPFFVLIHLKQTLLFFSSCSAGGLTAFMLLLTVNVQWYSVKALPSVCTLFQQTSSEDRLLPETVTYLAQMYPNGSFQEREERCGPTFPSLFIWAGRGIVTGSSLRGI